MMKREPELKPVERPLGRPPLPANEAQTAIIRERVTENLRAEYDARGGKAWLVKTLNKNRRLVE